jgi:hypothetical protein
MTERFRAVSRSPNSRSAERELLPWFYRLKAQARAELLVRVDQPTEPANHRDGDGERA